MNKSIILILFFSFISICSNGQDAAFIEFNEMIFSYLKNAEEYYEIPKFCCDSTNEIRFYILKSGRGMEKQGAPHLVGHNIIVLKEDAVLIHSAYDVKKIALPSKKRFVKKFQRYVNIVDFLSGWNLDPNFIIGNLKKYTGEIFIQYCKNDQPIRNYFVAGLTVNESTDSSDESKRKSEVNLKFMNKIIKQFYNKFNLPVPMYPATK